MRSRRQALWLVAGTTLAACTRTTLPTVTPPLRPTNFLEQLRQGGFVIYMRHAIATVGSDSFAGSNWWTSSDPALARQLSDAGRQQASRIGTDIRSLAIPIARIISSEFRRCTETAERFGLNVAIKTTADLTFTLPPFASGAGIIRQLTQPLPQGQNLLLVAHFPSGVTPGSFPPEISDLQQGDSAAYRPTSPPQFTAFIRENGWLSLPNQATV